ncbi:hypothetical protein SO802_026505 [Lithocarpus litseifolius]|uniref:Uncharacterized protein n=1 Tax=Lithocarpus litseifolius TaxID=425828 RepID=A0AAW2BZQ2_9ROSI
MQEILMRPDLKQTYTYKERENGSTAEKPSNEQRGNKGKRLVSNGKSKWATKVRKERKKEIRPNGPA